MVTAHLKLFEYFGFGIRIIDSHLPHNNINIFTVLQLRYSIVTALFVQLITLAVHLVNIIQSLLCSLRKCIFSSTFSDCFHITELAMTGADFK